LQLQWAKWNSEEALSSQVIWQGVYLCSLFTAILAISFENQYYKQLLAIKSSIFSQTG
jgi:hypothetical protein